MRMTDPRLWLVPLTVLAFACAPCHRPPRAWRPGMGMACGQDACTYRSKCFSEGAVRSNDGVCQACAGGKWTAASGCRESACHECGGMGKPAPCEHEHGHPGGGHH
jgi:hypothetical protein